jgi:hypothetical protein
MGMARQRYTKHRVQLPGYSHNGGAVGTVTYLQHVKEVQDILGRQNAINTTQCGVKDGGTTLQGSQGISHADASVIPQAHSSCCRTNANRDISKSLAHNQWIGIP